jgi:hypothetical protein
MRVAFLLSGAPRFANQGLFKLMDAISGYDQADFFIRTWKTDQFGNTAEEFVKYLKDNGFSDRFNYPVVNVLTDDPSNAPPQRNPIQISSSFPNFIIMWWGIVETYRLFKEYSLNTGIKYDLVVRVRTDALPTDTINLSEYTDLTKIYNAQNFGDSFIFGTPEMYEKFLGYWDYIDDVLSKSLIPIHPEETLRLYMLTHNIPYECVKMHVQPTTSPHEYKSRHLHTNIN